MQLKIREMNKKDVPYVCDIQLEAFGMRTPDDFDHCIDSDLYWYGVVEMSNLIIGYFGTMIIDYECELLTLAIDSLYRNMGIGKYVLAGIIAYAKKRGCKTIYLEVNENNDSAVTLYKNIGFTQRYIRRGYYDDNSKSGGNALVMQLEI